MVGGVGGGCEPPQCGGPVEPGVWFGDDPNFESRLIVASGGQTPNINSSVFRVWRRRAYPGAGKHGGIVC